MTEKQKMLAGKKYNALDDELREELNQVKPRCQQYNNLLPTDLSARNMVIVNKHICILSILVLLASAVCAKPVSREVARQAAQRLTDFNIIDNETRENVPNRIKSHVGANLSDEYVYMFDIEGSEGSIIVSADDVAYPILAYLDKRPQDNEMLPENIRSWFNGYERQIEFARENGLEPSEEIQAAWKLMSADDYEGEIVVSPLITTQWDQLSPYNQLVPGDYPTGCVATAMAQVMRYWKYPKRGVGQRSYVSNGTTFSADFEKVTYNWSLMPNKLTTASSNVQRTAVATIMYHCGVAARMEYNTSGSGAYLIESFSKREDDCAEYALKTYFGYKDSMRGLLRDYLNRNSGFSTKEWTDMVKADLDMGRPVLYSGYGDSGEEEYVGHAFICDGYTDADYFHFNWGWSGEFDGWFRLNALDLSGAGTGGGTGHFNYYQHAIFGLEPDTEGTHGDTTVIVGLDNLREPEILVYPNPVSDLLFVHTESQCYCECVLRDLSGREIYRVGRQKTNNPLAIDLSAINEGLYMLSVRQIKSDTVEGETTRKILIKR